jgi:type I restriction enzyme S subunit
MKMTPDPAIADSRFLYYQFSSPRIRSWIIDNGIGSSVPGFNLGMLKSVGLNIPPLPEQKAIARLLGTLDDKIELNRKTNETLEAMAKALFQSWFVDFDPVRAKAEGRPTGLPDEISDLFPDSFEEAELGEIPRGWEICGLERFLVLQRGYDLPATQRINGKYPVIAASGPSGCHNEAMSTAPGVVTGRSGVLGKVFYVQSDFFPLNTTLWAKEFRLATPIYAYFLLGSIDFSSFNAGSAVPTLNRNHLGGLRFAAPPSEIIRFYSETAVSLMTGVEQISNQVACLVETRDTLLPKLISGELRIPEAEKLLEQADV